MAIVLFRYPACMDDPDVMARDFLEVPKEHSVKRKEQVYPNLEEDEPAMDVHLVPQCLQIR